MRRYAVLAVADLRLALPIDVVERVVHAVEMAPADGLSAPLVGWVDLHGEIIAVLGMRGRLGLVERELRLSDRMVLLRVGDAHVFLLVDGVVGVVEIAVGSMRAIAAEAGEGQGGVASCCASAVAFDEGVVSILDPSRLLSAEQVAGVLRPPRRGAR